MGHAWGPTGAHMAWGVPEVPWVMHGVQLPHVWPGAYLGEGPRVVRAKGWGAGASAGGWGEMEAA